MRPRVVLVLALVLGLAAAASPAAALTDPAYQRTAASRIAVPWGVAFLPDSSALVAERNTGRIFRVTTRGRTTVGTLAMTRASGEGGLLGLAVSPRFDSDRQVFAYVTTRVDNRILAMEYRDGGLVNRRTIRSGMPKAQIHNGGRLAFGPDGYLYATPGDAGNGALAQNPSSLGGKILRLTTTGAAAPGNPTPGSPIWSSGHRDVQGIAWDAQGRMWASEFGQATFDELNRIVPGGNYGWPTCEGRCSPSDARFVDPVRTWAPSVASPSGLAFADGHLYLAALRGQRLWRIPVSSTGTTGTPQAFLTSRYGRLRTVLPTPAGNLWVTTSNRDGKITPGATDDRILSFRIR